MSNLSDFMPGTGGMRNRIINGDMRVFQRATGVTQSGVTQFALDRFGVLGTAGSGTFSVTSNSSVPAGFSVSLICTSNAATTVATGDFYTVFQRIEAQNMLDFAYGTSAAKTITLSFWVRSSLTGTFGGSLRNMTGTRSYPFTYTISVANTWENKSITIPGDTTGTWPIGATDGMQLSFSLGAGATFSATAGAWAAGNFYSATGSTNVVSTNAATWYVTGVQLEVGAVATLFEQRPYGMELALCQRYFHAIGGVSGSPWAINQLSGLGGSNAMVVHPITMRASPALAIVGTGFNAQDNSAGPATSTISLSTSSPVYSAISYTHAALTANAARSLAFSNATSYLQFSAEL